MFIQSKFLFFIEVQVPLTYVTIYQIRSLFLNLEFFLFVDIASTESSTTGSTSMISPVLTFPGTKRINQSIKFIYLENITKIEERAIYTKNTIIHFSGGKYNLTEVVFKWLPNSRVKNNNKLNLLTVWLIIKFDFCSHKL